MTALPVADPWFRSTPLGDGVTLLIEPHVHVLEQANIFLVEGGERDMVIDAGMGIAPLKPVLDTLRGDPGKPLICVLTHTHMDHMGSAHEFGERLVHPTEADNLARPAGPLGLSATDFSEASRALFLEAGYPPLSEMLIDAIPSPAFDPLAWRLSGCDPTGLLDEGDHFDLGGRVFEVLHLPGHSPGGIGLLEAGSGVLFAGDAIYDGPLIWKGSGMDVSAYNATLRRLRDLTVSIVHGGHDPSFGPDRMREICDDYLARFEAA